MLIRIPLGNGKYVLPEEVEDGYKISDELYVVLLTRKRAYVVFTGCKTIESRIVRDIMKKMIVLALVLVSTVASAGVRHVFGRADFTADGLADLQPRRFYMNVYNQVIYVNDITVLADGRTAYVLENIRGRFCPNAKFCVYPTQDRQYLSYLFPIAVTTTQD